MRSYWKGFFFFNCLFKQKIWKVSRDFIILPIWIGKQFKIYNGKKFFFLKVRKFMVGYKFGEFGISRKITNTIHLKNKEKRK